MHELASMAASKAQEMTYLPPPPPDMVSNDTHDKVSTCMPNVIKLKENSDICSSLYKYLILFFVLID